jgi:hypothetical protein
LGHVAFKTAVLHPNGDIKKPVSDMSWGLRAGNKKKIEFLKVIRFPKSEGRGTREETFASS